MWPYNNDDSYYAGVQNNITIKTKIRPTLLVLSKYRLLLLYMHQPTLILDRFF